MTCYDVDSFEECSCLSCTFVKPSFVIGLKVRPSWLQLCTEVPNELALNSIVENEGNTVGKSLHFCFRVKGTVNRALAILDCSAIRFTVGAKRGSRSVEVHSVFSGQVTVGAVDPIAIKLVCGIAVVETS